MSSSEQVPETVTLITFDVDGTLVRGNPDNPHASLHGKAFLHAVGRVFGDDPAFETRYSSPVDLIPPEQYHGSTDGLIALNLAKAAFDVDPAQGESRLHEVFSLMQEFYCQASDEQVAQSLCVIPGVRERLQGMHSDDALRGKVLCGLVTGNVEGIARKKMRSCGLFATRVFAPPAPTQRWKGEDDAALLGGFGSDHTSSRIDCAAQRHVDRGAQICIAFQRAQTLLAPNQRIARVVHVGDAPADVMAAKWCVDEFRRRDENVVVSAIAVATGVYPEPLLRDIMGESVEGAWEPFVLTHGLADERFVSCCKISVDKT